MLLALAQPALTRDVATNLDTSLRLMERAAARGADAVCFPELQLSPFFPQFPLSRTPQSELPGPPPSDPKLADPQLAGLQLSSPDSPHSELPGDASAYAQTEDDAAIGRLRRKCAELELVAFANVYLKQGRRLFDASLAIDSDGSLLGISKMVHVVRAPRFFEQDYYTPSDTGYLVHDTSSGRIGVVVCFDRHFPESFRACVDQGAQLVVIPTANVEGEPLEMFEWEVRVAAMQNGVFVAMCNRIGAEGAMRFAGGSLVVDPNGEVLARAGQREEVLVSRLELDAIEASRAARYYLPLRRRESYVAPD